MYPNGRTTNNNEKEPDIAIPSETNSCGLAALGTALNVLEIDISENELREILDERGVPPDDFGVYSLQIGILVNALGFQAHIHTHYTPLQEVSQRNPVLNKDDIIADATITDSLKEFNKLGGEITIYEGNTNPNFNDICRLLTPDYPLLVCVSAQEYYQIDEEWNHYLVLLDNGKGTRSIKVLDCLKEKGDEFYENWEHRLRIARDYNWKKFSGDIIEIKE